MWRVAEGTACRQCLLVVFASCLCVTMLATSRFCISCFPWCSVPPSPVFRDVHFLYLAFPAMSRPFISGFSCSVPVSRVSRVVRSLYLAFPAMFRPCISGLSFSVPVSPVSRDSHNPYLQSARCQPINIARPPAMVCVIFRFNLGGSVACSWGKAARPAEAK